MRRSTSRNSFGSGLVALLLFLCLAVSLMHSRISLSTTGLGSLEERKEKLVGRHAGSSANPPH
jgi:hypothetical protein